MSQLLRELYLRSVQNGEIHIDAAQEGALSILDVLREKLFGYSLETSKLRKFFGLSRDQKEPPKGLYLYGDVGRGKSMLMDMFFDMVHVKKKRRVHFHQFMLEIHERLHQLQSARVDDILPEVARAVAQDAWLLCFDEFHVSNIADAMILGRLFASLFDQGVVIVATSNWSPYDLYKNGLQRDRFLPFIDILKAHMQVHNLNGLTDHRYEQTGKLDTYFVSLNEITTHKLEDIFSKLTDNAPSAILDLPVQGRHLKIARTVKGVGFFNFEELCGQPLGPADFLAIAECLNTILLDHVPKLRSEDRNETLRFMMLIDTLYEAKVKLFMATAVPLAELLEGGEHAFAFQRTLSRLMEMQGEDYRRLPHLA